MREFFKLLNLKYKINKCKFNVQECHNCMNEIHYEKKDYECKKGTFYYFFKYYNRYASEFYHLLKNCFNDIEEEVNNVNNILSIGSGPFTEGLAIEKFFSEHNTFNKLNINCVDKNKIWEDIQICMKKFLSKKGNKNCVFYYEDITEWKKIFKKQIEEVDLILINYVLSNNKEKDKDWKKLTLILNFLKDFVVLKIANKQDFYILINEVNSKNTGRDQIIDFIDEIKDIYENIYTKKSFLKPDKLDDNIKEAIDECNKANFIEDTVNEKYFEFISFNEDRKTPNLTPTIDFKSCQFIIRSNYDS